MKGLSIVQYVVKKWNDISSLPVLFRTNSEILNIPFVLKRNGVTLVENSDEIIIPYMIIKKDNEDLVKISQIVENYHMKLQDYIFQDEYSILNLEMDLVFSLLESYKIKSYDAFGPYQDFSQNCIRLMQNVIGDELREHLDRWSILEEIGDEKDKDRIQKVHESHGGKVQDITNNMNRWISGYQKLSW